MKILAIETATEACSAALLVDDQITERFELAPRGHGQLILPMMDELLSEAQLTLAALDAIAFGRGPGAFTGLRIAAGVVQGVAFALDLPVIPISSLAALAHGVFRTSGQRRILAALDARMNEVYYASYEVSVDDRLMLIGEERLAPPPQVPAYGAGWTGAGTGWMAYGDALQQSTGIARDKVLSTHFPRAYDVALLAADAFAHRLIVRAEEVEPVYLRNEVAWKKQ